jgi:hypothetical protein
VPDDKHRVVTRLTLGLSELALVNTSLNGLAELGIESGLEGNFDLVVRGNILLDGLTAVLREEKSVSSCGTKMGRDHGRSLPLGRDNEVKCAKHICYHCTLSAIGGYTRQQLKKINEARPHCCGGYSSETVEGVTFGRATRTTTRRAPAVVYSR